MKKLIGLFVGLVLLVAILSGGDAAICNVCPNYDAWHKPATVCVQEFPIPDSPDAVGYYAMEGSQAHWCEGS